MQTTSLRSEFDQLRADTFEIVDLDGLSDEVLGSSCSSTSTSSTSSSSTSSTSSSSSCA